MATRIKILHLIKSLGRGGAEKLIPETVRVHNQERFEFYCIYFYHQENNIVDELEEAGIQVHLIPSGNLELFFQVKKVKAFIAEHGIQIIHAHLPWAGILSRLVGKDSPIPIVYTEHNTWDRYNRVSYWGNRMTFKNQDVAIAVSNEVALSMQLNSVFDPYHRGGRLKVKVIQNGVNTDVFRRRVSKSVGQLTREEGLGIREEGIEGIGNRAKGIGNRIEGIDTGIEGIGKRTEESQFADPQSLIPNIKSELGIPADAKVIGKVAVFRSQKRLWIWVDTALKILETCPKTHFLLVGDGEWRERILEQINESGKSANFHWVGVQKQVIPYLSIMDIYLSTSEFEGLPIAMLEAMACEVPVVATRAGGIGEMIQHGVQGFLTEIDNYEELFGYCIALIQDSVMRQKMAESARTRVVDQFSMQRMVKELEEVYESVIVR